MAVLITVLAIIIAVAAVGIVVHYTIVLNKCQADVDEQYRRLMVVASRMGLVSEDTSGEK